MVKVYAVRVKNKSTQMLELAKHKGTEAWIKMVRGEKVDDTGEDVDPKLVDSNGRYNPEGHR